MPRCEGLPDGPCPQNVNNRTVKLTQGDLMLCPKCDAARFPPVQGTSCIEPADNDNILARKASTSAHRNVRCASKQPSTVGVEASITACDAQNHDADDHHPKQRTAAADAVDEISALRQTISTQQSAIAKLQTQLAYVLSYLGVEDTDISIEADDEASRSSYDGTLDKPGMSSNELPNSVTLSGAGRDQETWSQVVSRKRRPHRTDTFQQSIVAAVYMDQTIKKRRENSLIVSGLASSSNTTDAEQFTDLCTREFNVRPDIIHTKRLGRLQTGRIQPLLVHLKQADQTNKLIKSAKQLRHSTDQEVREKVYINPNLTKAEAVAAYQIRTQRRLLQQRTQQPKHEGNAQPQPSSETDYLTTSNAALPLNPSAGPFIPSSTTSSKPSSD
jgi:hypothetical protein